MKRTFLLIALTIGSLSSLSATTDPASIIRDREAGVTLSAESVDKDAIIDNMRGLVTVHAESTTTITYDDPDYSYLDSTSTSTIDRDYGYIVEDDGTHTDAVRYIDEGITYFRGDDNCAYYETLTASNTITTTEVTNSGMSIAYEKNFRNPWQYIDSDDIDDDLYLETGKASLILECYFGVSRGVVSAQLIVDDENQVTSIDYTIADIPNGYTDSSGDIGTAISSMTCSITYTYGETQLRHLTPSTLENSELDAAIENIGDNYTIAMTSSALSTSAVAYVTEDHIFLHLDGNARYPVSGDYIFETLGSNLYYIYQYDGSSWNSVSAVQKDYVDSIFLPSLFLDGISTSLFEESSDGIYTLLPDAVTLGTGCLIMPLVSGFDDLGLAGYVEIEDEHVTSLGATFNYYGTSLTLTTSITDYGTTVLPGYINTSRDLN